jgi:hypothetical protein
MADLRVLLGWGLSGKGEPIPAEFSQGKPSTYTFLANRGSIRIGICSVPITHPWLDLDSDE